MRLIILTTQFLKSVSAPTMQLSDIEKVDFNHNCYRKCRADIWVSIPTWHAPERSLVQLVPDEPELRMNLSM